MEINQIPILTRRDLLPEYKNAPLRELMNTNSFHPLVRQKFYKFNIILFHDDNGDIFVIKNRYGRNSKEYLEYLLRENELLVDRYIDAEKFIINLSNKKWWHFGLRKKCRKYIEKIIRIHGDKKS